MNDEPLPNRHRYAAEIEGYRPGIIRRVLMALHLVKRAKGTSKANWHYSEAESPDDFICCTYPGPNRQINSKPSCTPSKVPPRRIKHI